MEVFDAFIIALHANYLLDVKHAKNNLFVCADCPPVPDGLWTDVLLDQYIDFDHVFSSYYATDSDTQHTQLLGDIEFVINGGAKPKPNKAMRNHSKWAIAFTAMKATVLFAYPHRTREYVEYEKFIVGQFATILDISQHAHVVALDCAIRLQVSRSNDLSLDRINRFTNLITHHIVYAQTALRQYANPSKHSRTSCPYPDDNICRHWNAGRCVSDTCKFQHVCLMCGLRHQAKSCPAAKVNDGAK